MRRIHDCEPLSAEATDSCWEAEMILQMREDIGDVEINLGELVKVVGGVSLGNGKRSGKLQDKTKGARMRKKWGGRPE